MEPSIVVEPKECLADEDVKICIHGLRHKQSITIHAELKRRDVGSFESYAQYVASPDGTISLDRNSSVGGTYSGIEPMGLFWSMIGLSPTEERRNDRLIVRDVKSPIIVRFRIYDSHLNVEDLHKSGRAHLAEASVTRWYASPDVKRIPIRWKRVRGTLFVPSGRGPFPALIDLYGGGGLIEHRAALLASRGFMCLALAYFGYEDFETTGHVDLGYFEEAKNFLESRAEVDYSKIGILGLSFGGLLALICGSYITGFKCVVCINGPLFVSFIEMRYKDRIWDAKSFNFDMAYDVNGAEAHKYCFDESYDVHTLGTSLIEFAECDKPFLFIFSTDDHSINNQKGIPLTKKLIENGKGDYKLLVYERAGHIIDPRHFPHSPKSYLKHTARYHYWGGEPKEHARAQEHSWREILTFLQMHLTDRAASKL